MKSDRVYKACIVAKGFHQIDQDDEVYSPVAGMSTLKIFLSVACVNNWKIEQMNVLNGSQM